MVIDNKLDPADLKKPRGGRPPEYTVGDLLETLTEPMTSGDWQEASDIPRRTFYNLLKQAKQSGLIYKSPLDSKWSRKP